MPPQVPESEAAKIREELFAGRKIGAIKMLREATGLGLKDAKDVVEKLEEELRVSSPEKFSAKKGVGCAGVLVCGLLFLVCSACLVGGGGRKVAENILSWQWEVGSWPKNVDTAGPFVGERKMIRGTFDNGATCD